MSDRRKETWVKGRSDVEQVIKNLNTYFTKENAGYSIHKIHPLLKTMEISDKAQYNTPENRTGKASFTTAMGLDCHIEGPENGKVLSLFLRYSNDWSFYIKLLTKVKTKKEIEDHLKTLQHYFILFAARPGGKVLNLYSELKPLKEMIQYIDHKRLESEGNKNRLQFNYNPSSLFYLRPEESRFFTGTLLNQIEEAMK